MNNLIEISNIYYNNALDYVKNNKISKAVKLLEKCLKYYAKDVQTLNLMGICQYMLCNFDKSYFYWRKSLTYDMQNNRAGHYLNSLNSDEFKILIEKYNLAIDNINNLKYEDAINALKEINQLNKELIEPYVMIGLCYYGLVEYDSAKHYVQLALSMDRENVKCLMYLNEINSKNIISSDKNNKFKSNNIIAACCIIVFLLIAIVLYYEHNKYIQMSSKLIEYKNKLNDSNLALEKSKSQYSKAENELKNENQKNGLFNVETTLDNKNVKNKKFSGSQSEIFKNGISNFKNQEYSQAIDNFKYIVSNGIEEDLVAESTYYLAVCYEKKGNYKIAEKYYSNYISKFVGKNYYDDSLYNYGLMLYKQGYKDNAKNVLKKLQQEFPNSIFINSKVRYILDN
ncbi:MULTISPECIES: tetratricopeptide repeat protein [Clostridium]|uniref:Tetratricopeptide repeat protein n=1 Tax=Clostridium ragsdalei P11 TaxID=1353534 RepID=A0A1A6AVR9_9CLOT|nr:MULTISPECIES: tetratricopeptide repeat protein [Clostridium]OBR94142.1 tetratricopeptide repeat protein [Clostridium ragsdalei P11]QXE20964.1 hypothetical protein B5S50_20085 [Clostridium sp. 001]